VLNKPENPDLVFLYKNWSQQLYTLKLDMGSITMMPKPPGANQLSAFSSFLASQPIHKVVSLLQINEAISLGLEFEETQFDKQGIEFINFQIKDHNVPQFILPFNQLVKILAEDLNQGKNIAIHCYAGIGRTGILAAALLINLGESVDSALIKLC
jgi:protein-tyrosine phosphatase